MDPELTHEMRHIPPLNEIVERVDVRLRATAAVVAASVESWHAVTPSDASAAEALLGAAVRWLDRLADHNRHFRRAVNSPEASVSTRLQIAFDNAVAALRGIDEKQFRKRANHHSFDKSHAEGVFGCVLAIGDALLRAADLTSTFDRALFANLYDRILVTPPLPELHMVATTSEPEP